MEIAILHGNSLRIKGKQAACVVDPTSQMPKTSADFTISLKKTSLLEDSKIDGNRLSITGPGGYEVGGIKVSATLLGEDIVYELTIEGVDVLLANSEGLKKAKEKIKESSIIVVFVDTLVDEASVTASTPSIVILYGEKVLESAKVLGQEAEKTSKFSITNEKLPEEMKVVILQ